MLQIDRFNGLHQSVKYYRSVWTTVLELLGRNGAAASNDPANAHCHEHGQYSRQPPLGQRRYRTLDATASQRMIGQRAYISVGHRPHPVMARQEVGDTARAGQVWIGVYPRHI
jgi:hypothetical protein